MTEHRLMCLPVKHIEGMHLKTKVTVFRCCTDTHGENGAKKPVTYWDLCTG